MQVDCNYKVINRNRKCFKCKAKQQRVTKIHERLAEIKFIFKQQSKIYKEIEPPKTRTPNIIVNAKQSRRERSVKCTLISFKQEI